MSNFDQPLEEWRPVVGYEGLYEVSSLGAVRSIGRTIDTVNNGTRSQCKRRSIVLKTYQYGGYLHVPLYKRDANNKNVSTGKSVHRLVAEAFLENPLDKPQVNHINGNKLDNPSTNLEWVTRRENHVHASLHGLLAPHKTMRIIVAYNEIESIMFTCRKIAWTEYDFDKGCTYRCMVGDRSTHKGYKWTTLDQFMQL